MKRKLITATLAIFLSAYAAAADDANKCSLAYTTMADYSCAFEVCRVEAE